MKKSEIARRLAQESGISRAAAADELDRAVTGILARLRKGDAAAVPGLGIFMPGRNGLFEFEHDAQGSDAKK